jgi:hypothetical protein
MESKQAPAGWKDWNPTLKNGDKKLESVLKTMPANEQSDISSMVKLFENPASIVALPGAVSLERHDCIHVMLGRGLLPQDEAFVIGFTMGTSKYISGLAETIFKKASKYLYPHPYKFNDDHLVAFELGMKYGKICKVNEIYEFPFEHFKDEKISSIRRKLGINTSELKQIYKTEKIFLPNSKESKRLDIK